MIDKLQSLKGKTKSKTYQNISNYYDEKYYRRKNITFQFEENVFLLVEMQKILAEIHKELLILMKFVHTKPQNKSMKINY